MPGLNALMSLQSRNIYYDRNTCRPHSHPEVLKRYFRLRWGGWIRARPGFKRHLWKKPFWLRSWAIQHVFVKDKEREMLEKMISADYKRSRYFIDDIYEPYHRRTDIDICPPGQRKVCKSYIRSIESLN